MHFFRVIEEAIKAGKLPPPPGGWTFEMAQVSDVPRFLIPFTIPCWLETWSLTPKLLLAPAKAAFVTSDNPVILLNQFAAGADPHKADLVTKHREFAPSVQASPKPSDVRPFEC